MAAPSTSRTTGLLAVGVLVLLVPAVRAELGAPGGPVAGQTALVALVAAAFAAAGLALARTATSPWVAPSLVAVGIAWLLPSLVPGTLLWHQAVLLVALTIPVRGPVWGAVLTVLAAVVGFGIGGQPAAAAVFAGCAVAGAFRRRPPRGFRRLQAVAAGTVALSLGGLAAWQSYGSYAPFPGLVVYELSLMAVGVLLGAGGWLLDGRAARMQERLLAEPPGHGVDGLMAILRDELGDPTLRLLPPGAGGIPVIEDGRTVGVLSGREGTLADSAVAGAAAEAVRVVRLWVERRQQVDRRQTSLVEARRRVSRAVQEERRAMATELGTRVVSRIRAAVAGLDELELDDAAAAAAVAEAQAQLVAADRSITDTVSGAAGPPAGGIVGALALLAARSAVPCTFLVDLPEDLDLSGGPTRDGARALSFVCSEALANVHKHADASQVEVTLTCPSGLLTLSIRDDGRGGADPAGSGLRGLAERLRALGGTLSVGPANERGTEVVARVPADQPVEAIRVQGRSTR